MIADRGDARDAVVETLSLAFEDDPAIAWMSPRLRKRRRMLPHLFRHMRQEDLKFGSVMRSPGGEVATLWRAPGKHKQQLYGRLRTTLAFFRILGAGASRGSAIAAALAKHHPPEDHWYLRFIGVRPDQQGKGWGGVALRQGIERAEADGVPIYLETATPSNVGLYQRFGFTITNEWDVEGGGPHFWGMMRPVGG